MGDKKYLVAVVGAGPAGLYGARELAQQGAQVALFNRDIKPGGLAEYGIYPAKYAMKKGLRKQFKQVLETPGVTYYGNLTVGQNADLSLDDLRAFGFQAILVTTGAQGTKWLGLPGEDQEGVYHAKDVVYFYNKLPPFSQQTYRFGPRCIVVGAGNVMIDIVRYLVREAKVEEVTAVVRRGPAEIKFTKKEMGYVAENLDLDALDAEIARVAENMKAVGQDPEAAKAAILAGLAKAAPKVSDTRFRFEFLTSPKEMLGDDKKLLTTVNVEDNQLILKDGVTKPRGTGNIRPLEAETIVFAIGDKVDEGFGLPVDKWSEFVKNENPRFPIDGKTYETYDPETASVIEDVFVAGWSRVASNGLVGYARKDGINGTKALWSYLETLQPGDADTSDLEAKIATLDHIVNNAAALRLYEAESAEAEKQGLEEFKFDNNEEMLKAMGL
ncbi:MAG: hypothetical protein B6243_09340 [Anaerolineaceae bacterium 4572_5.2]|nr:MAG: hypothetical protein B6243_09340 [Anaerolineaceae bacterium 4572_5.2]